MKVFVFLLLLTNLLFAAYAGGYFGRSDNPDALRLTQQVVPERLRIVSRGEAPSDSDKAPVTPDAEATVNGVQATSAPVPAQNQPEEKQPEEKTAPAPTTCLAWDHLTQADADRISSIAASKFAAFKLTRRSIASEGNGWWVFIPPQASKADADKKASELKLLEIDDFFVVQDGINRWAISLGVFSTEKGAQDRLGQLKAKGVRSAHASPRLGKESAFLIQANGPASAKNGLASAVTKALPKVVAQDCK